MAAKGRSAGTPVTGGKQRGTKIVTGSTSVHRIGQNHRAEQKKGGGGVHKHGKTDMC